MCVHHIMFRPSIKLLELKSSYLLLKLYNFSIFFDLLFIGIVNLTNCTVLFSSPVTYMCVLQSCIIIRENTRCSHLPSVNMRDITHIYLYEKAMYFENYEKIKIIFCYKRIKSLFLFHMLIYLEIRTKTSFQSNFLH